MASINFAIQRLLSLYPLHGAIVSRWQVKEDESIGTMSVGLCGARIELTYAPSFIEKITVDECCGVLCHEIAHIIGDHITMTFPLFKDKAALIVATEVTANEYVKLPLPGKPVLLKDYPQLTKDQCAIERYDILAKEIPEDNNPLTIDNHDWTTLQRNPTITNLAVAACFKEGIRSLTTEQKNACSSGEIQYFSKYADLCTLDAGKAQVDWRHVLRKYVGKTIKREYTFSKPPRRYPELMGVVPSYRTAFDKAKVLCVIDTSASIDYMTLRDISAELGAMNHSHEVTVVECDDEVRRVYPYKPIREVAGRGGTDFHPPLDNEFLKQHRAELVIYFTDGMGEAPAVAPKVSVIWCIISEGKKPCSWGSEIRINTNSHI